MLTDARTPFADAIRAAGMTPPDHIEADGELHRFAPNGKRHDDAGWYVLHVDGIPAGSFGDWRTGKSETWRADIGRKLSPAEAFAQLQRIEESRRKRETEERRRHAEARERAAKRWEDAVPANPAHTYLARKRVKPHGIRQEGDTLLIPMRDGADLHSLLTIAPSGDKLNLAGGRKTGCYFSIGKPGDTICIAEGYATGATVHEATGYPVAVAFDCGNLPAVARILRGRLPGVRIIVCADDDYRTAGNPGVTKGTEAAKAVGGLVAIPDFGADRPDGATDFNDLAQHAGADAVKRALANASSPDISTPQDGPANALGADPWPEPHPFTAAEEAQPYPIDVLPGGIGAAVAEVIAFVQCPPALAACSALSALSLAGQGLADVQRAESLDGPIGLFLLAVAESGERKSTCDGYFLRPIREWEREQTDLAKPDVARHLAIIAAWEERKGGIKARIREASKKGRSCDALTRELELVEAESPEPFRVPRLVHADATPEALAWSLARGWPSGGVMSSEAGIVFGGHGMGRDSVMQNLSLLNALWDGASHRVERRTSDSFTVVGARLTMGLAVQPETIRQFMEGTKGLARGNGFAARFLIAAPATTQGARSWKDAPTWRALPAFSARLRNLLDTSAQPDDSGALTLPMLTMTREARQQWERFYNDVEAELRPGGEMADARDVASKAADNVARLAALFHLFAYGTAGQIGAESVAAAARIVGWHLYQARAFLNEVAAPREAMDTRRLDAWLLDRCRRDTLTQIDRRTIQQYGPLRGQSKLKAALAELVEAGRIREVDDGRRKLVRINPALLEGENGTS